jgi:hypothetical protein
MRTIAAILAALVASVSYAASPAEPVIAKVYPGYDLPVFRLSRPPIFDPSVLISHMKQTIDPKGWTDGDAEVHVFKENMSFVIIQTPENHDRIRQLLDSLRWRVRVEPEDGQAAR